ncbi:HU family DNA-binding protein [Bacteroides sp. 224]|uniref:HU family DNA-binding protein n=1 Tax=Bacteroides sp. 224 TaxID=2302936 RepID=UPI0013D09450|nr:HU family DNA-binding protein [Bacteroides sp. 224]NDV66151.1 DNA-binding protein [Bacteroides sp. 224]
MAIPFKKTLRVNPAKPTEPGKYYPNLLTLGKNVDEDLIIHQIKELSSLSKGDIKSVVTNLLDVVRTNLYSGHSVTLRNFGTFSLSARSEGSDTEKDCTAKNIKTVRINFRPSKTIRPDVNATRAEDKLTFIDFDTYIKNMFGDHLSTGNGNNEGNGDGGNNGGGDEFIDPSA